VAAARRLLDFGDPDAARKRLKDSLASVGENVAVLIELSNLEAEEFSQFSEALKLAKRAVELSPANLEARLAYGSWAAIEGGRGILQDDEAQQAIGRELLEAAQAQADAALKLSDSNAAVHRLLADVAWRRSFDYQPTDPKAVLVRGEWQKRSLVHSAAAIALEPSHVPTRIRAARLCLEHNDAEKALEFLGRFHPETESYTAAEIRAEASLKVSPPDYMLHTYCVEVMRKTDDSSDMQVLASLSRRAALIVEKAKDQAPPSDDDKPGDDKPQDAKPDPVPAYMALLAELIHECRQVMDMGPSDRLAVLAPYLPNKSPPAGRPRRPVIPEFCYMAAEALFHVATRASDKESVKDLRRQALGYLANTGLDADQRAELEAAIPYMPLMEAFLHVSLEDWSNAEKCFKRFAKLKPTDTRSQVYALLMPEIAKGNFGIGHAESFLMIREAQLTDGDRIKELEKLVAARPKFALARSFLGTLLNERGAHEAAKTQLVAALEVWPDHEESLLNLGRAEMHLRNWKAANDAFIKLQAKSKDYGNASQLAEFASRAVGGVLPGDAVALYLQSMPRGLAVEARASLLDRAIDLAPEFSEALASRSLLAAETGDLEAARNLASRAIESAKGPSQRSIAEAAMADVAAHGGEYARAASHYKAARASESRDEIRKASLAYLEATVNALAGNHRDASATLAGLSPAELQRLFPADRDAANRLVASMPPAQSVDLVKAPGSPTFKVGQRLNFKATMLFEVEGGRLPTTGTYDLNIGVECLGTPDSAGAWDLRVNIDVPAEFQVKGIHGLTFPLIINPWFGISNTPKEIAALPTASQLMGNLIVQSICECFAGGLGTVDAYDRAVFGRKSVPGLLHLTGGVEASIMRIETVGERNEIATERLAIADYRDPGDSRFTWAPRHRMTALAARDADSGLPRRIELRTEKKALVSNPADVEITRVGLRLDAIR